MVSPLRTASASNHKLPDHQPDNSPSTFRRYGVAVLCAAGSIILRWLLDPVAGPDLPLATIFGFVAVAVWYGGWKPALLTVGLSYFAAHWLFIAPRHQFGFSAKELWGIGMYLFSTVVLIGIGEAMRRAQHNARSQAIVSKHAYEALHASEQHFRMLFDSMDEGYCVIQMIFDEQNQALDYRFLEINRAFEGQTGIKDAKGRLMREIVPTHEQHWFDIYGRVALTGETVCFENEAAALSRWYDVCAFRIGAAELHRVGIVFNDITERKRVEKERLHLLAREWAAREEAETLHSLSKTLAAELDVQKLLQKVTDSGTHLVGAELGAFFYNIGNSKGESYTLFTLPGGLRETFVKSDIPGNTPLLEATLQGTGVVRIDDLSKDVRYGQNPLQLASRSVHVPMRSYLAVPVISRSGEVLGGLFFGHPEPHAFTERAERFSTGLAAQAAIAIDNARLYEEAKKEIVERQRSEKALRESEERLRVAQQAGRVGSFEWNIQTGVNTWTPELEVMYGLPLGAYPRTQRAWEELVHIEDRTEAVEGIAQAVATGLPMEREFRVVWPDGSVHWLMGRWQVFNDDSGNPLRLTGVNIDITERKNVEAALQEARDRLQGWNLELEQAVAVKTAALLESEERLRALATELNLAEQRERKRLATDLHDHLAQMLVVGHIKLSQAKQTAQLESKCLSYLQETENALIQSLHYTRTLVADLAPPVLHDLGLPAGLRWLAERMKQQHQLTVAIHCPECTMKLPTDQAMLLFQSVRELLINTSKHAQIEQACVSLEVKNGELRIEVRDQGLGFDVAAIGTQRTSGTPPKFGLFSIRERMRALGGRFDLVSSAGQGTRAVLILPLTNP